MSAGRTAEESQHEFIVVIMLSHTCGNLKTVLKVDHSFCKTFIVMGVYAM